MRITMQKIKQKIKQYLFSLNTTMQLAKQYMKYFPLLLTDKRKRFSCINWWESNDEEKANFPFNTLIPDRENWTYNPLMPQFACISVFGKRKNLRRCKATYKIFYTGEDCEERYTEYKDYMIGEVDISLGYLPKEIMEARHGKEVCKNYMRYPLWLLYYFNTLTDKDKIAALVKEFNAKRYAKTKFAALVARHDKYGHGGIRKMLVDLCAAIDEVSCGGKVYHNDDDLKNVYGDNKIEYLKQFMFNICPENLSTPGYTTEKLFQSFDAGCIPIYWGGGMQDIESYVINKNAFLLFAHDKSNGDELTEQIRELWTNKKAYDDFIARPRLLDSAVDWIYDKNTEIRKRFTELFAP